MEIIACANTVDVNRLRNTKSGRLPSYDAGKQDDNKRNNRENFIRQKISSSAGPSATPDERC
jgi:hypothetical protein